MIRPNRAWRIASALLALLATDFAAAARLEIDPSAPVVAHWGAALLLFLHIAGGAVGIAAGFSATLSRKGGRWHRISGKVFVIAMAISFAIGGGVAPFMDVGQRPNLVAGILSLYLLLSAFGTARRRQFEAGWPEQLGLIVALSVCAAGITFFSMGAASESGTVDGAPPQAFILFTLIGGFAALGEINALVRRTLSAAARLRRHLWRMCLAFFMASGSLFLGQPQVFPTAFSESAWPLVLAFYPIMIAVMYGAMSVLDRTGRNVWRASAAETRLR